MAKESNKITMTEGLHIWCWKKKNRNLLWRHTHNHKTADYFGFAGGLWINVLSLLTMH